MKAYFDTNVLVAASVQKHQHHPPAFELVKAVKGKALQGFVSTHGIAEYYSVLTRAPFTPRVHPSEAGCFLEDNILPYFTLVALEAEDYKAVIRNCINQGLIGGVMFDVLHLHAAQKAGCDRVYTFNLRDFRRLSPSGFSGKISSP
ncbi:MAG: type II toxin-antitoxin system VapC family toxin [Candidatus Solibacter usitatus]|nr:type II toxin-antitoxin system VapC family toxin [Candidatus Solibacter usitatus]